MAAAYKTPGVYIVEQNAFPNSIVEVPTAVPAFIGYTQKADYQGVSLFKKPVRISSMLDFVAYFGGPPTSLFSIAPVAAGGTADFLAAGAGYALNWTGGKFNLYYSMLLFFQNGGGSCYVVSVGPYQSAPVAPPAPAPGPAPAPAPAPAAAVDTPISLPDFLTGLTALESEQEPTMVVIPDAVLLDKIADFQSLQEQVLLHCGTVMKNRFAILDVYNGDQPRSPASDPITAFRNIARNNLDFGAAYYPWLKTTIVQDRDIGYTNIDNSGKALTALLNADLGLPAKPAPGRQTDLANIVAMVATGAAGTTTADQINRMLLAVSPGFAALVTAIARRLNVLPPSGAMAGLYTLVDNGRGVWKAPANVGVNSVIAPAVNISNADQEDLNAPVMGKAVNAIRWFINEGVLVWGARTLDSNSLDWRYINVRRTMIMLEESCKLAAKAMVFEPNVDGTWLTIRSMIENFLTSVWKRGGLAGAVPEDAFSVHCGLGDTMTADDILEGILRVTVLVAVSHPAEFIEITFKQQMQKS